MRRVTRAAFALPALVLASQRFRRLRPRRRRYQLHPDLPAWQKVED
jgi:hypothetical protein